MSLLESAKLAYLALSPADRAAFSAFHSAQAAGASPAPSVTSVAPGEALATLAEASFLTPRGKFAATVHLNATVLKSKSAEIIVPHASVVRMFTLPESSGNGDLLVLQLSPPAINGKAQLGFVMVHSKKSDAELSVKARGDELPALSGKLAAVLGQAVAARQSPPCPVGALGSYKSARGVAALACYHKATEAAAYLLESELLVREGGKVTLGTRPMWVARPSGSRGTCPF